MENKITISAVCGSLRNGSYTRFALDYALVGAAEMGANIKLIDLKDYKTGFFDGRDDFDSYPDDAHRLKEDFSNSDGIILGTPEYHSSVSGVLKNALDFMSFKEFEGKMVGLIGISGGSLGATNALNSLRNVGRSLHAWVIPQQVSIPSAWKHFDKDGKITNEQTGARLKELGQMVAKFSLLHCSEHSQEFLKAWESAYINPGGNK